MDHEHETAALSDDVRSTSEPGKLVVTLKKKPPPESSESIRIRSLVVASFWAIVIFLGLPIWWWTTSIHRARLPLREMLEWADGKVFYIFKVLIRYLSTDISSGVQTCISSSNHNRCALITGERSRAPSSNHSACA